jgi:preprotein translocase SecE subunit
MARNRQRNRSARRSQPGARPASPSPRDGSLTPAEEPIDESLESLPEVFGDVDDDGRGPSSVDPFGAGIGSGMGGRGGGGVVVAEDAFGSGGGEVPPEALERPGPRGNIFARGLLFFRNCWAELQRVQWPDRQQVAQATGVVLGFVVLTGVFLGVCDFFAGKLVNWIV